jgi:uncharacterized protein (UPF0333 family)
MAHKLQINISNKAIYSMLILVIIIVLGIGVYAFGTKNPSVFGHSSGEVQVNVEGSAKSLQDAIDSGDFGTETTGTLISITAGTGLSGGTIITSGTISADFNTVQRKVAGSCSIGSAIRVINSDGSVSCQAIPPSAICTYNGRTYSSGAICRTGTCPTGTFQINGLSCSSSGSWSSITVSCTTQSC